MSDDLLGGDPFRAERTEEDEALAEYIETFGLDAGLALYKEDYGLDLNPSDFDALERFSKSDEGHNYFDVTDEGAIDEAGGHDTDEGDHDTEYGDYDSPEQTLLFSDDPDSDYSPWERDDGLDFSPHDNDFEPYIVEYTMYMADGSIREGSVRIYHDDSDIEDVIWAANEDVEYDSVSYINWG